MGWSSSLCIQEDISSANYGSLDGFESKSAFLDFLSKGVQA